jgi:hypothetical protein
MSSVTMLKKVVYASSNSSPLSSFHHELPQSIQWIITSSPSSRWQGMGLDLVRRPFPRLRSFGRQGGPLRVLLRTFLYGFIFVLIYSATVDLKFGLIAGAGLGLTPAAGAVPPSPPPPASRTNGALVVAEFERDLISERTKASLASARARGRKGGAPFKMTAATIRTPSKTEHRSGTVGTSACSGRQSRFRHRQNI